MGGGGIGEVEGRRVRGTWWDLEGWSHIEQIIILHLFSFPRKKKRKKRKGS